MTVHVRGEDQKPDLTHRIWLRGDIDMQRAMECETLLERYQDTPARDVSVDLMDVTFFDSTGLGFLARLRIASEARDGRVTLLYPSPQVLRILQLVAFDTVFEIVTGD